MIKPYLGMHVNGSTESGVIVAMSEQYCVFRDMNTGVEYVDEWGLVCATLEPPKFDQFEFVKASGPELRCSCCWDSETDDPVETPVYTDASDFPPDGYDPQLDDPEYWSKRGWGQDGHVCDSPKDTNPCDDCEECGGTCGFKKEKPDPEDSFF